MSYLGYQILKWLHPPRKRHPAGEAYESSVEKLQVHFGESVFDRTHDRTIIDFGSGHGNEAIEYAKHGAKRVIGLELRPEMIESATRRAADAGAGVSDICSFAHETTTKADIVISLDSFEHFHEPDVILETMSQLLNEEGEIWISFGWSWYHPHGGHLFSVFPWAHLIFSEASLIRWRSDFIHDGATRFHEVSGGLNQMTIAKFERLIQGSNLRFEELTLRPIRPLRFLHSRFTREFTTSLVFARLKKHVGSGELHTSEASPACDTQTASSSISG